MTTLPAPTIAFSPMLVFERIVAPEPMDAPFFMTVRSTFQSASVCRSPSRRCGARITVVDKRHPVPDEDVVFNDDAFADKGVAGDLAAFADAGIFLDFHECADLRLVPDLAPIQIYES